VLFSLLLLCFTLPLALAHLSEAFNVCGPLLWLLLMMRDVPLIVENESRRRKDEDRTDENKTF
jgi:hypothetical protein